MKPVFTFFSRKATVLFALFLLTGVMVNAQLKIGNNPTAIQRSSILELESSRQGLLLPRLSDTAAINLLTPPDGMIIFLTTDASLRVRSNGGWRKMADSTASGSNWSLSGNSGTDSAGNYIGTRDGRPFTIKTNNLPRMIVSSQGNIGIGTTTPTAKLNVDGTVRLQNLASGSTEVDVLVLAADGSVYKRTMSSAAFTNTIRAINGIQRQTLSITADTSISVNTVTVTNRTADSTIAIYLPVQNGSAGASKPYGLLSYTDWLKLDTAAQTIAIGAVSAVSNAFAATVTASGSTRTITLHPANATNPGIVTAGTQTFGGNKTFRDSVTLNGPFTMNNISNNASEDSVLVINNGLIQKRQLDAAAFGNTIRNINGNRDSVQVFAFANSGTDLTVSTVTAGADSIYLNVPNAGTAARGVVTTTLQTFGGVKKFQDSVTAATALLVGSAGNSNSTVQVNGSLSMSIRTVTAATTLSVTDNTVLANTTSSALTITLPAAGSIVGRIYTIKKIGTGDIDNALTITPAAGTIDGGASLIMYNDYSYVTLQTDGTNWYIIKK